MIFIILKMKIAILSGENLMPRANMSILSWENVDPEFCFFLKIDEKYDIIERKARSREVQKVEKQNVLRAG